MEGAARWAMRAALLRVRVFTLSCLVSVSSFVHHPAIALAVGGVRAEELHALLAIVDTPEQRHHAGSAGGDDYTRIVVVVQQQEPLGVRLALDQH